MRTAGEHNDQTARNPLHLLVNRVRTFGTATGELG
jgi:hypothetical protein